MQSGFDLRAIAGKELVRFGMQGGDAGSAAAERLGLQCGSQLSVRTIVAVGGVHVGGIMLQSPNYFGNVVFGDVDPRSLSRGAWSGHLSNPRRAGCARQFMAHVPVEKQ